MIRYHVRSFSLLNLVNDVRAKRLVPDAFFQRNLVWRDVHKRDFIETILKGYPFPQIFISKGEVDVDKMATVSCIVDGQQRTSAIIDFVENKFDVGGEFFKDLDGDKKAEFLKYDIAVIELDLQNDSEEVQEIFQRINRTSNSLTSVEKLASEFSTSEFMLVAKYAANNISSTRSAEEDFREDPSIPDSFFEWAAAQDVQAIRKLYGEVGVFSPLEVARKVNLMHVLNLFATMISGFFNRNEKALEHLNNYMDNFSEKTDLVKRLNDACTRYSKLSFGKRSYWQNKANVFSLIVALDSLRSEIPTFDHLSSKNALDAFFQSLPEDYKTMASEAVNSVKARSLRNEYLLQILRAAHAPLEGSTAAPNSEPPD